jgi:uncharacterized protein YndB with AHSA1/START domain
MMVEEVIMIDKQVKIAASRETVFSFLVDADKMRQWMGQEVTLDPQPGGIYRTDLNGRNIGRGEFLEVDPPSRVVISFGWEGEGVPVPSGSTRVEFILPADGEGTLLRLRHLDLPADEVESHTEGWMLYLTRLTAVAEGRDPGTDPNTEMEP